MDSRFCWFSVWLAVFAALGSAQTPTSPSGGEVDIVVPEIDTRTYIPDDNGPCAKSCKGYNPQPLCAFDIHVSVLRSFLNTCDLTVAECYAGRIFSVISYEEACEYACPKVCPHEYNEVCGSDNVTYKNPCRMKQAACVLRIRLGFRHWGPCKNKDKLVFPEHYIPH